MLARAQAVDRARLYRESILPLKLAIDLRYAERHGVRGDLVSSPAPRCCPRSRAWRRLMRPPGHAGRGAPGRRRVGARAIVALVGLLAAEGAAPF